MNPQPRYGGSRYLTFPSPISRRSMLRNSACGFGFLGLAGLLAGAQQATAAAGSGTPDAMNPLAPKPPHHAPKAKRVIFLFMPGGPSHVDLFDPKPRLAQFDGKPISLENNRGKAAPTGNLMRSPFAFRKHGQSGTDVSELFPHVARHVDDLCVIRSMLTDNINHNGACLEMCTGEQAFCRPSLGAWLLYGLGTENQNLPGFVAISPNQPAQGAPLWGSSFLPAAYQGTYVADVLNPVSNMGNSRFAPSTQREQLDLARRLNGLHSGQNPEESQLNARIAAFELAFRMQAEAPEAFDIERESEATRRLYGVGNPVTDHFGKQCLLARRLIERGVRMVQLFHTKSSTASGCQLWDHHGGVRKGLINNTAATDWPIAGLLQDLKSRDLLKDTLVIWGGEFGRTPTLEGVDGRGHHPFGFTMWLAGGGIKGGLTYGATDEFGWHSAENKVHVHDLHATILHLMGIQHERLTYNFNGRNFRLTDVYGSVVHPLLA